VSDAHFADDVLLLLLAFVVNCCDKLFVFLFVCHMTYRNIFVFLDFLCLMLCSNFFPIFMCLILLKRPDIYTRAFRDIVGLLIVGL